MGKLIIIEGTDGSGKQTQTLKLYERLKNENTLIKKISFPDYESESSTLVKMYLRGDFGKNPMEVNPYAASTFYAIDRYASYKTKWGKDYENGITIISDRYTGSNMIHHASKINDLSERNKYLEWLEDLEYNKLSLPRPNLVIFLNVEIEYSFNLMRDRVNKITGSEKKDIHESDLEYLRKSYYNALEIAKEKNWLIINCVKDGKMRSIDEIHNEIYEKVKEVRR